VLSRWAKLLMMVQAMISLTVIVVLASRASIFVNMRVFPGGCEGGSCCVAVCPPHLVEGRLGHLHEADQHYHPERRALANWLGCASTLGHHRIDGRSISAERGDHGGHGKQQQHNGGRSRLETREEALV